MVGFACLLPAAPEWRLADDATLAARLEAYVEDFKLAPGAVIGVFEAGAPEGRRTRYFAGGVSGRRGVLLNEETLFEVGSITKGFTGLLLAEMVERGEVALDTPLAEMLPGVALPADVAAITLEQLATHRSGLPRLSLQPADLALTLFRDDPYAGFTREEVIRSAAGTSGRKAPGTFMYSNLGYALLGQALAIRAGREFPTLLREEVLEPYELRDAWLSPAAAPAGRLARGFRRNHRPSPHWELDAYAPAGGLVMSTRALTEFFARVHATAPAGWERAITSGPFDPTKERSQPRLGWMRWPGANGPLIWHNGGTGGFRTFVGYLPEQGAALVLLTNGQGNADALALGLLDPAREPVTAPNFPWTLAGAATGIVIAPMLIAGARHPRRRQRRPRDRLDAVLTLLCSLFLLVIAQRFAPWQVLPFALWWISAAATAILAIDLLRRLRPRPWLTGPGWSLAMRLTGAVVTLGSVLLLV